MILKLQRPVEKNQTPMILVYNENRSREFLIPMTEQLQDLFQKEFKVFVDASFQSGDMKINGQVEDPGW